MTVGRGTAPRRRKIHSTSTSTMPDGDDGGSATIWVLAAMSVVLLAGLAGIAVGGAVVARHRAESAADLAALAGADGLAAGSSAPCNAAAELVRANGGLLVSCTVIVDDVVVVVQVAPVGLPHGWGASRASARAGPVDQSVGG